MVTFEQARATVAATDSLRRVFGKGFTVAEYGWENPDVYQLVAVPADGVAIFDTPTLLVDKATGKLRAIFGMVGRPPSPDLVPIGNRPPPRLD